MATTIDFPPETEEQLQQLADRTGKPVDQLVVDTVEKMLSRESRVRPRPKAIGIVSDGGIDASNLDDWLAENWIED